MDADSSITSSRYLNLKKSFKLGIRSLLTAFSKEDVHNAFSAFTDAEKESLYRMFVHVIKSLHGNIEEEFDTLCRETEVCTALGTIDQLIEEQNLDVLSTDKTSIVETQEQISRAKKDEIQYLTSLLEKVQERNKVMKNHIELAKTRQDSTVRNDVVEKLRSWNSEYESYNCSR
ncbi:uncharacterized protein [Typha angustifolia]|uniref:uncharacterized protein n=1 Tax=Typha angustifolia TaxID=59011 RepID=UPI003C2F58DE